MRSKDSYRSGKRNRGIKSDVEVKRREAQAGEPRGKSFYALAATANFFFPPSHRKKAEPKKD
jgi:hypothetical protein